MGSVTLTGVDVPLRLSKVEVTGNLADVWGLTPVLGRPFERRTGSPARRR